MNACSFLSTIIKDNNCSTAGRQHDGQCQFIIVCRLWRFALFCLKIKPIDIRLESWLKIHRIKTLYEHVYLIELEMKDTIDTARSASYHDLHLEIGNEDRLRMKRYDRKHDKNLPIVNFPFICSTIPAAPASGIYRVTLSWLEIPELLVSILASLIEGCC